MKRWLWFLLSILLSTGVYFTIRYGLRPKPIPVLNATEFAENGEIGAVTYRRLRQDIRAERVVLLGSTSELPDYAGVWSGLLKTALADHVKIPVIFQREGLKSLDVPGPIETVTFNDHMVQSGELIALIKTRLKPGEVVVVHDVSTEVSHLLPASLSRALDTALGHPVLSLSSLWLTLRPEEMSGLQAQCLGGSEAETRIECAEWRVGKILLKKKITEGKIWAVMERHGLKEYLLFIHR